MPHEGFLPMVLLQRPELGTTQNIGELSKHEKRGGGGDGDSGAATGRGDKQVRLSC